MSHIVMTARPSRFMARQQPWLRLGDHL